MKTILLNLALPYITSYKSAVDGGAYKGEWIRVLCEKFEKVYAFEPQVEYASILAKKSPMIVVINAALMNRTGTGKFVVPPRTKKVPYTDRSATVVYDNAGNVSVIRLDDLSIEACGLIKLNIEGCEPLALEGARNLLTRDGPVIIMEESNPKKLPDQYKRSPKRARNLLSALGYQQVARDGHDTVWARGSNGLR